MNSLMLIASNFPVVINKMNRLSCKNKNGSQTFYCQTTATQYSYLSGSVLKPTAKGGESKTLSDKATNIDTKNGIGILEFLAGKKYFITGGTGLLGKAVIEKILRASPEVDKVYVLIKARGKEAAMERLKSEIIESDLFECIRRVHGNSYQAFMLSKLVPVPGNVEESNLGMDPGLMNEIAQEADVIINSAANTTLDSRFDVAVNVNARSASRVLDFGKQCRKLCAFVHISTAFVHKERKATANLGDNLVRDRVTSETSALLHSMVDVDAEMTLAMDSSLASVNGNEERAQKMKKMGLERARRYDWAHVYLFTKAMAEKLIDENRGEIPVIIVRPSIIESTYKEPYPGWLQGNRMLDPLILSYGKGYLPVIYGRAEGITDVIPLDMTVNAIIAAMAKHGRVARKPRLTIIHVVSSGMNPLVWDQVFNFCYQYFNLFPFINIKGKKVQIMQPKFIGSIEEFSSYVSEAIAKQIGLMDANVSDCSGTQRLERLCKKLVDYTMHLASVYAPYTFSTSTSRFEFNDTQELLEEMSEEEKLSFGIDIKSLDWKDYFLNIHIPGLIRKHAKKGRGMIDNYNKISTKID